MGTIRQGTGKFLATTYMIVALLCVGHCLAQSGAARPEAAACVVDPLLPAFEVAAITPVAQKDRGATHIGDYGYPRFSMRGTSLSFLLGFSFDVQPANFINAPQGLEDAVFDVEVKSADGVPLTYEAIKPRMQQLLEQRFCLKGNIGTKQVSGYALVSAKGGPKIKPDSVQIGRGSGFITQHDVNGTNLDMRAFAGMLASPTGRPVQDQTGLQGKYTIKIQFSSANDADSTLPSIFTVVKEQLGLELKPAQVAVPTLIIEHLNLFPTEN